MEMGTLFSLSKSATSIALDTSEIVLLLFGVLLTVGLIGEYAKSERWKRHVKIFEMLVIIGVAGELLADGGIFLFSSHLQTIADQEIGDLATVAHNAKGSADDAAKSAKTAHEEADAVKGIADEARADAKDALIKAQAAQHSLAQAESDAAKAQSEAANALATAREARKEADSFEKDILLAKQAASEAKEKVADRELTNEQVQAIAGKLKHSSGQIYTVTAYWSSKESMYIANRVALALNIAGWAYSHEGEKGMMLGGVIGIFVYTHPDADPTTKELATNLVAALVHEGLSAELKLQNPTNNPKHNTISLEVGASH
jgi:hypothetical protein